VNKYPRINELVQILKLCDRLLEWKISEEFKECIQDLHNFKSTLSDHNNLIFYCTDQNKMVSLFLVFIFLNIKKRILSKKETIQLVNRIFQNLSQIEIEKITDSLKGKILTLSKIKKTKEMKKTRGKNECYLLFKKEKGV